MVGWGGHGAGCVCECACACYPLCRRTHAGKADLWICPESGVVVAHGREAGEDSERHLSWAGREVKAQEPMGWEARADRRSVGELAGRER